MFAEVDANKSSIKKKTDLLRFKEREACVNIAFFTITKWNKFENHEKLLSWCKKLIASFAGKYYLRTAFDLTGNCTMYILVH